MLKRSLNSLWHSKKKNAVIILLFAVIFLANIICMTALKSTRDTITYMEQNVKNTLTIKENPIVEVGGMGFGISPQLPVFENRLVDLENDEYVEEIIYYASGGGVKIEGTEQNQLGSNDEYLAQTTNILAVTETERSTAFTVRDYTLLSGEHINEDSGSACLISKEFSELNSVKVGDELNAYIDFFGEEHKTSDKMTVKGIYELPKNKDYDNLTYGDFMFITLNSYQNLFGESPMVNYESATVILKDDEYTKPYINYVKEQYMVVEVYDSHFGNDEFLAPAPIFNGMSEEEITKIYEETLILDIYKNTDWYEMTAGPLETQVMVFTYIVIGLQIISVVILAILAVILINSRKREIAILLSMGETKVKICVQMIVEFVAPLLIAVIIGGVLGLMIGNSMTQLFSGVVNQAVSAQQVEENELTLSDYKKESIVLSEVDPRAKIILGYSSDITVVSNFHTMVDTTALIIFSAFAFATVILVAFIQSVKIAKLNPAQILMSRKE